MAFNWESHIQQMELRIPQAEYIMQQSPSTVPPVLTHILPKPHELRGHVFSLSYLRLYRFQVDLHRDEAGRESVGCYKGGLSDH